LLNLFKLKVSLHNLYSFVLSIFAGLVAKIFLNFQYDLILIFVLCSGLHIVEDTLVFPIGLFYPLSEKRSNIKIFGKGKNAFYREILITIIFVGIDFCLIFSQVDFLALSR